MNILGLDYMRAYVCVRADWNNDLNENKAVRPWDLIVYWL